MDGYIHGTVFLIGIENVIVLISMLIKKRKKDLNDGSNQKFLFSISI